MIFNILVSFLVLEQLCWSPPNIHQPSQVCGLYSNLQSFTLVALRRLKQTTVSLQLQPVPLPPLRMSTTLPAALCVGVQPSLAKISTAAFLQAACMVLRRMGGRLMEIIAAVGFGNL